MAPAEAAIASANHVLAEIRTITKLRHKRAEIEKSISDIATDLF
ncbi:MAG: hypothetical protein QOF09_5072 [Alphaproteobacteria bacterium]|jgi:hypothetical protein|nr:hypothetical protein [Alphaproteobacteria bacterium]